MLNVKDLVTLDDEKTYVVSSKAKYKDKTYYILIDFNSKKDVKFVYELEGELILEEDEKLLKKIMPLFIKSSLMAIKEEQSG